MSGPRITGGLGHKKRLLLLAERARLLREALDENHSGNLELLVLQLSEEVVQVTDLLRDTIGELLLGVDEEPP